MITCFDGLSCSKQQRKRPSTLTVEAQAYLRSRKTIAVCHSIQSRCTHFADLSSGVLAVLLNNGTCPTTGVRLLSASTVDDMFTNQIPQYPQFGRQGIPAANPDLTNAIPDLYPTKGNTPQGWGLACMLTGGPTGRSDNTGWWAGLSNIFWWVDRENGIGGMVCSQVLPFGDAAVMGAWFRLEAEVYAVLREGQST